jgi:hypothetical protein
MKIRTNKIMDGYLEELGYNFWEKSVDLTDGLSRIIK